MNPMRNTPIREYRRHRNTKEKVNVTTETQIELMPPKAKGNLEPAKEQILPLVSI